MANLIHENITSQIIVAAFDVSNCLGVGFLEKIYENALKFEIEQKGLTVETPRQHSVIYKGVNLGHYQTDLLVDDKVIVEVKSVEKISSIHWAQLLNYLKITGFKVGLVINFGKPKVEFKRVIL